jgi:hypothetical protein
VKSSGATSRRLVGASAQSSSLGTAALAVTNFRNIASEQQEEFALKVLDDLSAVRLNQFLQFGNEFGAFTERPFVP